MNNGKWKMENGKLHLSSVRRCAYRSCRFARSVDDQTSDPLAVKGCIAEHQLRGFGPLVIEVNVFVPREPDPTVYLNGEIANFAIAITRICFSHRNGQGSLFRVVAHQPRRIINSR